MKLTNYLMTFLILMVFNVYSQKNIFSLNKEIKINFIKLNISYAAHYVEKEIILNEVKLIRFNDSLIEVHKTYQNLNRTTFVKTSKISSLNFDNYLKKIKSLNFEKINSSIDDNIYDGSYYNLEFGDNTYKINLYTNSPQIETESRGLIDFLKTFDIIYK